MTFFFLYNPKYYDPGAAITDPSGGGWIKKKKEEEFPETKELEEKKIEFIKIREEAETIRKDLLKKQRSVQERIDFYTQHEELLRKEAELARAALLMEEEELAVILMLLER